MPKKEDHYIVRVLRLIVENEELKWGQSMLDVEMQGDT